jgi:hypothetical protein
MSVDHPGSVAPIADFPNRRAQFPLDHCVEQSVALMRASIRYRLLHVEPEGRKL